MVIAPRVSCHKRRLRPWGGIHAPTPAAQQRSRWSTRSAARTNDLDRREQWATTTVGAKPGRRAPSRPGTRRSVHASVHGRGLGPCTDNARRSDPDHRYTVRDMPVRSKPLCHQRHPCHQEVENHGSSTSARQQNDSACRFDSCDASSTNAESRSTRSGGTSDSIPPTSTTSYWKDESNQQTDERSAGHAAPPRAATC